MSRAPLARRAFLGLDLERAAQGGLSVVEVSPGSGAERAGVLAGDVLFAVGGERLGGVLEAHASIGRLVAGENVRLSLRRGEALVEVEAELSPMPLERLSSGRVELSEVELGELRLRAVWTFPEGSAPYPAVWLLPGATWLSEEQPLRDWYPTRRLTDELTKAGFATLRVERSGLGDSEGPACTELDLDEELRGFRAARSHFFERAEVDPARLFLYGRSLGGMLAPLLAQGEPFAALAVWGTSAGPWHRAMLDASRVQYELAGQPRELTERVLSRLEALQELVYVRGLSPSEAYAERPDLANVQPETFAGEHVYGRSFRYFHQLEHARVAEAWRRVSCPVLALRGSCDYLSTTSEHERIARLSPRVTVREVPGLDHHMHERSDLGEALREPWGGSFSPRAVEALVEFYTSATGGAARDR